MKTMIKFAVSLGVILMVCIAGCVKVPEGQIKNEPIDGVVELGGVGNVYEFTLHDGTRCAALSYHALSCDWKHDARSPE